MTQTTQPLTQELRLTIIGSEALPCCRLRSVPLQLTTRPQQQWQLILASLKAHTSLGQAILCRDFAWATAERELLHAIELNPDYSVARILYALQLAMEGRFTESLREAQTARDLDPMAIISRFSVVWCSYHARRFEEGYQLARTTLEAEPRNLTMLHGLSFLSVASASTTKPSPAAQKSVDLMGKASHTLSRLGSAHARAGNIEAAEAVLVEMDEIAARRHISPYHRALVHCGLGRTEKALDLLETAFDIKDAKILWMGVDPELDPLHGHPRFNALLRKLNHRLAALPTLMAHSQAGQESIAVLPFKLLGASPENTGRASGAGTHRCLNYTTKQCPTPDRSTNEQRAAFSAKRLATRCWLVATSAFITLSMGAYVAPAIACVLPRNS